ncbi:MAG: hypothetical protein PHI37_01755 [Candidatus Gracilibacteria bacterium]|nr:hypothetical protein [Candidatus Gracilibacteria bacterium]
MSFEREIKLSNLPSFNGVSEYIRNAVLETLKEPLEQHISDTQKSVELINSLLDYITFLEGIFLGEGQHFTAEDLKTPGLSSLLMTSNRHDEEDKREILEFFREQFKALYPRIFTGESFNIDNSDNPVSLLVDAIKTIRAIRVFKSFFLEEEIKKLNICDEQVISFFRNNRAVISIRGDIFPEICHTLGIENNIENFIKYLNSKLLSVFTIDQDKDFALDLIKKGIEALKRIKGFDFDGIFDVDLFNLRRLWKYNCLLKCVKYFKIKSAKDLSSDGIEEVLRCEEFSEKIIYFEKGNDLMLSEYEGWFGRKFTLEEAGDGTLKNIFKIYKGIKEYGIKLDTVKNIFDYLDKERVGVGSLRDGQIRNLVNFFILFTGIEINKENFEKKVEILRDIIGIDLDLEWVINTYLNNLLEVLIGKSKEVSYGKVDTKETLYKPFFAKFPQFVGVNEDGEKYSENWDKKHFKGDKNKLREILIQTQSIDFIMFFVEEFGNINDVLTNQNFQLFQNISNETQKNIVNFIKFVRKYNLFEIKISDVNEEFIRFINNAFASDKIPENINLPDNFFDENISLQDFEDPLVKSLILEKSKVFGNLEILCAFYNLPVKLSSFRTIFNNYVEKYKDTQGFLKFFIPHDLRYTTRFIIRSFPKDLTIENLIYILISQYDFRLYTLMHHVDEGVYEKEQLLQERLGLDTNSYFKKNEEGNYIFNENRKDLLRLIFDDKVNYDLLETFINTFTGLTLGKLINFYKADGFNSEYAKAGDTLILLIQYSLDKNNYAYLENNIDVIVEINKGNYIINKKEKLKTLLDKTGGYITEKFMLEFVIGNCSEEQLDEMIADYERFRNILLSGGTLNGVNDSHGLIGVVVKDVYPERSWSPKLHHKYSDATNHLKPYKFDRNGYHINLTGGVSYELVGNLDEKVVKIYRELFERLSKINSLEDLERYLEEKAKENNLTLETSTLEARILEYYKKLELSGKKLQTQDLDVILFHQILTSNQTLNLSNIPYDDITKMMEEFGDKFKESLASLVKKVSNDDTKKIIHTGVNTNSKKYKQTLESIGRIYNIFSKVPSEARNIGKLKKLAENNLKAFFDEKTLNDILDEIEAKIDINNLRTLEDFSKILLEIIESKSKIDFGHIALEGAKYYSKLESELKKFEKKVEEGSNGKQRQLDMYFMKTKESSRARGVAGNCAGQWENMWENENYFELVLFDRDLKQCVGVVELLVMDDKKGRYLLYGPTPRETYLEKVDPEELYNKITEVVIGFAKENGFDGILTNTTHGKMGNATGKFAEVFQRSVKKDKRINLSKEYVLFGGYKFKDNLEIIWEK